MEKQFVRKSLRYWISLLVILCVIVGCAFKYHKTKETAQRKTYGYTHKLHTENDIACKGCHLKALTGAEAGMPDERLCGLCHKTVYDNQPVERFYNRKEWLASYNAKRAKYLEINMSHQHHASAGIKCEDCHSDIGSSITIAARHIPDTETCLKCHKKWNTPAHCGRCHKEIRHDTPPASHTAGNFPKLHGRRFRDESASPHKGLSTIPTCSRCHSDDHCINCHQNQPPENHNNQWRLIGHGITAGIDRGRCGACHKTDFCLRCHENTRPRSHRAAGWGKPNDRHCQSCHLPIGSTGCIVCHKGTPGHFEAPEIPDDIPHRSGFECRICHFGGSRILVHADNGQDCKTCHK